MDTTKRKRNVESILKHWVGQDLDEAPSAVFEVPDSQAQNCATEVVIHLLREENPTAATAWAESLRNRHAK